MSGGINREGIDYYNNFIDELLSKGREFYLHRIFSKTIRTENHFASCHISHVLFQACAGLQPFVTLFHFDSPQGLEDKYGGFLSHNIV